MLYILFLIIELLTLFFLSRKLHKNISRAFYRLTKNRKITIWLMAVVFLPGTFVHEISHFLAALFLLVPVGKLELMAQFDNGSVKLGSVSIAKTDPIRRFFIGIAPFIFGLIIIFTALYLLLMNRFISSGWVYVIVGYVVFEIGNTMFLSKRDLEGVWKLVLILFLFYFLFHILGFQITILDIDSLLSNEVIQLVRTANYFLLVPVGIDLLINIVFTEA